MFVPHSIPLYTELLSRDDLERADCMIYGAIVALGADATPRDIARVLKMNLRYVQERIAYMAQLGLVKRHRGRSWHTTWVEPAAADLNFKNAS